MYVHSQGVYVAITFTGGGLLGYQLPGDRQGYHGKLPGRSEMEKNSAELARGEG